MNTTMAFTALGSGSSGNAFAIQSGSTTLLVDAGFSCRELCRRLSCANIDPESVRAVLLTHDHADHACGCRVFCNKWQIPLFACGQTITYLEDHNALPSRVYEFEPDARFELEGFDITCFPVSHDACAPVGFVLRKNGASLGIATDLGIADHTVRSALAGCDMLVFESNYDDSMLDASGRPLQLKKRIKGRRGHLGNLDAMRELPNLICGRTKMLTLVHVSRECNDYDLVAGLAREMLAGLDRPDIYLEVARQDDVGATFRFPQEG